MEFSPAISLAPLLTFKRVSVRNGGHFKQWGSSSGVTPNLSSDKTAKEYCDIWNNVSGATAVKTVRGIVVNNCGSWDIPNEFELMVCFMCADKIDALDPTASAYATRKIGKTHQTGRFVSYFWSCTQGSSSTYKQRYVDCNGVCGSCNRDATWWVLPIREL